MLEERIEAAKRGRKCWLEFIEKYDITAKQYVILLPDDNKDYNRPALKYLPEFLEKRGITTAYVLTWDKWTLETGKELSEGITMVKCNKQEIQDIIQLYCLYEFAPNIIIASLDQPSGRKGNGIIGKKNLENDEVFAGIVYSLVEEE